MIVNFIDNLARRGNELNFNNLKQRGVQVKSTHLLSNIDSQFFEPTIIYVREQEKIWQEETSELQTMKYIKRVYLLSILKNGILEIGIFLTSGKIWYFLYHISSLFLSNFNVFSQPIAHQHV